MTTILDEALALGDKAKGYRFGAVGPDYFDCSGLVLEACKKAGIYASDVRFTTYTVKNSKLFERVTAPRVDDIVVWSENSAHGHMGIISGPDEFYSARSVKDGLGFLKISTFHVYPVKPFYLRPVKSDGYAIRTLRLVTPQMYGEDVEAVQRIVDASVDGFYGRDTVAAVKVFQGAHHLDKDGVVGPLTRGAMHL